MDRVASPSVPAFTGNAIIDRAFVSATPAGITCIVTYPVPTVTMVTTAKSRAIVVMVLNVIT